MKERFHRLKKFTFDNPIEWWLPSICFISECKFHLILCTSTITPIYERLTYFPTPSLPGSPGSVFELEIHRRDDKWGRCTNKNRIEMNPEKVMFRTRRKFSSIPSICFTASDFVEKGHSHPQIWNTQFKRLKTAVLTNFIDYTIYELNFSAFMYS